MAGLLLAFFLCKNQAIHYEFANNSRNNGGKSRRMVSIFTTIRGDILLNKIFNSGTQSLLEQGMDYAALRNDVLANNIANADTPGFKRSEVIFRKNVKKVLQNKLDHGTLNLANNRYKTNQINAEIVEVKDTAYRNDGNNVDIDVEMTKLSKNKLFYDALGQCMSNEIRLLRLAITGR